MRDRICLLPFKYHSLAFGFRYRRDTGTLVPATRELLAFEHGVDDTVTLPYVRAGYTIRSVPNDSVDITNTYNCGAFSTDHHAMVTGVSVSFSETARIVPASDVKREKCDLATDVEYIAFPRDSAAELTRDPAGRTLYETLLDHVEYTGEAAFMPPGTNSMCTAYVGPMRYLCNGSEAKPSWRPKVECICEPNKGGRRDFHPNRMRFKFRDTPREIPWPDDVKAPADGDFLVVDFFVRVEVANVRVARFAEGGGFFHAVEAVDQRAIGEFMAARGSAGSENASVWPLPTSDFPVHFIGANSLYEGK